MNRRFVTESSGSRRGPAFYAPQAQGGAAPSPLEASSEKGLLDWGSIRGSVGQYHKLYN